MNDTAEKLQAQIDETKSQLSEKLDALELQVSETVQAIGTAVNGTVSSVQETVETVAGAVQDAAKSASQALDVWQQIDRRPWLVLGGSVVLGCLAFESLAGGKKKSTLPPETLPQETPPPEIPPSPSPQQFTQPSPPVGHAAHHNGAANAESVSPPSPAATAAPIESAANTSGPQVSFWQELRSVAIDALVTVAADAAARAVPRVVHYLASKRPKDRVSGADDNGGSPKAGS